MLTRRLAEVREALRTLTATLIDRMAVGEYRRHMKTIGYLGQLDSLFGTLVTTRSWKTVSAIVQVLKDEGGTRKRRQPRY